MSEEKDLKQAQAVYKALCDQLDSRGWHYKKDQEKLMIECGVQGEDLPMELRVRIDKERKIVSLLSQIPFVVPENRRNALAVAVSVANFMMIDGSFDYNYVTGRIIFRMTTSYLDSLIGKELFGYMLSCSCYTIDVFNDRFLMVAKQDMSDNEIVKFIKGGK